MVADGPEEEGLLRCTSPFYRLSTRIDGNRAAIRQTRHSFRQHLLNPPLGSLAAGRSDIFSLRILGGFLY